MSTLQPVNPRATVPATFVEDFDKATNDGVLAGNFHYALAYGAAEDSRPVALLFGCPCGCRALNAVHLRPYEADGRATWEWDGNRLVPTLTPSILIYQLNEKGERIGEHWHGFLTNGVFTSC